MNNGVPFTRKKYTPPADERDPPPIGEAKDAQIAPRGNPA